LKFCLVTGPKRKLDAIAAVRGHSGLLNDEKCLRRLRAQLALAQSVSEIKSQERLAKKAKTEAATEELFDVAPRALTKLRSKGGDVTKLFKSEVHATAYRYFSTTLDGKPKSGYLAAALGELIKSRPGVLNAVVLEAEAAGVAAMGAVVVGAAAGVAAAAVAALPPWGGAWGRRGAVTTRAIATSTTVGGALWLARSGVSSQQRECPRLRPFYEKPVWVTDVWIEKRRVRSAMLGRFDIGPRCSIGARGAGL